MMNSMVAAIVKICCIQEILKGIPEVWFNRYVRHSFIMCLIVRQVPHDGHIGGLKWIVLYLVIAVY